MPMSAKERQLRARQAAHKLHATRDSRELTQPARDSFLAKFERQVDPDGELSEAERQRRAEQARKAYFADLARQSAKVRRQRKGRGGGAR